MNKWWIDTVKKSIASFALAGVIGVGTIASANGTIESASMDNRYVVSDNWLEAQRIYDGGEEESSLARYGASLPSKYDPRDVNGQCLVTSVKDQGGHQTCWAFATIAAMESNLIKNGYADNTIDLSENHFAYFFYNRQTDKLGNTAGDYNIPARPWDMNAGTLAGTGISTMTWAGATTEQVSPYFTKNVKSSLCYRHEYSARNLINYDYSYKNLDRTVKDIKQAIMQYGAVATGMFMDENLGNPLKKTLYIDEKTGAYFCYKGWYSSTDDVYVDRDATGTVKTFGNHAVTIVGWDDNYSRYNFKNKKPSKNGAWIVKNSYGTSLGDNGYIYISYEDHSLAQLMAIETVPASEQYDNNYQYDGTSNPTDAITSGKVTTIASVYKAKGAGKYCEELKAVAVYSYTTNCSYEVQVYSGLTNASKPTSGTKVFSSPVKGTLPNAGYQTIELPKSVLLMPGERFSVVITLKNAKEAAFVGVDYTINAGWIRFNAKIEKNQSFMMDKKKWVDMESVKIGSRYMSYNIRMKAFTNATKIKPSLKLTDTGVSKGSSITMGLTKPGNICRKITWSSSNPGIATISSKGKIKGKKCGTTTVTATFQNTTKKKTLKCKVTVGPKKIKGFNASVDGNTVSVKWKKGSDADGYEIVYATSKNGKYSKLASVNRGKTKASKSLNSGVYYVKMRPYKKNGKKKLFGSYTAIKQVTVQ